VLIFGRITLPSAAIYTTNAIESLNSVIRKSIKNRKIFNHDDSAFKIVFLAVESASKKWTMSIRNWPSAINQFIIIHEDRLKDYVLLMNEDFAQSGLQGRSFFE
jgi:transposase-like protein